MAKYLILGGTFDPIHNGHLALAEKAEKILEPDVTVFLPAGNPPHKFASRVTPAEMRLEMLRLAVSGRKNTVIREDEVRRTGYTYAADTLRALRDEAPAGSTFLYLVGEEVAARIPDWKNREEVCRACEFVIVRRPGFENESELAKTIEKIGEFGGTCRVISGEGLWNLSATELRERPEEIREKVPGSVADYIEKHGLYRPGPATEEQILADLRGVLDEKRYLHSLGVAEECVRLAKLYGADEKKARLAGLLHDCAKNVTPGQLSWIGKTPEDLGLGEDSNSRVLHGPLGAYVAESRYGVTDPEVLRAIGNHVTGGGAAGMELLDAIVFVADYTEKNRKGAFFDSMREELNKGGLRNAIVFSCRFTMNHVRERGEKLDPRTVGTYEWALSPANRKE